MPDVIAKFFSAWEIADSAQRREIIVASVTEYVEYTDPRTPETLCGIDAVNDYVGMFSANAPGWSAWVVGCDIAAGVTRANIAFGGPGPDGSDVVQMGQYFVEVDSGLINRIIGFVGTGQTE